MSVRIRFACLVVVTTLGGLIPESARPASVGDIAAGRAKAAQCKACHGESGISPNPVWPNLAGQNREYLVVQLKMFRGGERKNVMMAPIAKQLSDADIENLSSYFSSLSGAASKSQ